MLHAHTVTSSADLMPARVAPAPAGVFWLVDDDGSVISMDSIYQAHWFADAFWPAGYCVTFYECGSVIFTSMPASPVVVSEVAA